MVVVTDYERYQYAQQAGFSGDNAVIATALSIAENAGGDPRAKSGVNDNKTFDWGLWQINSNWFAKFGGQEALADPLTNARAAFEIFKIQGFNAWCTYWPTGCGSANANKPAIQQNWLRALDRAQKAANSGPITAPIPIPFNPPTTTEPVTTQPSIGGTGTPAPSNVLDLDFGQTIQHSIAQILLIMIGIALLLGGIYLIGGRS